MVSKLLEILKIERLSKESFYWQDSLSLNYQHPFHLNKN